MSLAKVVDGAVLLTIVTLLVRAIVSLIRTRRVRQYPLPFAFLLSSAVLSLTIGSYTMLGWMTPVQYARFYWANELIEQGFALALMVYVIRLALAGEQSSAILSQGLASVAVILVAALLTDGTPSYNSRWMTGFTRNLSFGVALMNFQVWGLLIAKRVKNREVLLLAAGLGLFTTGKSLGHTFRIVAEQGGWAMLIGNYIVVATGVAAAYAWWCAFRPRPQATPRRPGGEIKLVKAA